LEKVKERKKDVIGTGNKTKRRAGERGVRKKKK